PGATRAAVEPVPTGQGALAGVGFGHGCRRLPGRRAEPGAGVEDAAGRQPRKRVGRARRRATGSGGRSRGRSQPGERGGRRGGGLAVGVLSLGELSAGKGGATPGSAALAHVIFEQLHRGVPGDVAALCLVLLLAVACGGALVALVGGRETV